MDTIVTIEGVFECTRCIKNEYGVSATITEVGKTYPQSFTLTLPDGHMWVKSETFRLNAVCTPRTVTGKESGNRFMFFNCSEYKRTPVKVTVVDVKESKPS